MEDMDEALGESNIHREEVLDAYLVKYSDGSPMKYPYSSDSVDETERGSDSCREFCCNICLDSLEKPVVTLCGHLYCWPCIYKWMTNICSDNLELRNEKQCPVCRSDISRDTLIPIYQTTELNNSDIHSTSAQPAGDDVIIPPRPAAYNPYSLVVEPADQYSSTFDDDNGSGTVTASSSSIGCGGGIFGELIEYSCFFGNSGTTSNSYHPSGTITNPRLRLHLMKMDESLNRMSFFLLCCAIACLICF